MEIVRAHEAVNRRRARRVYEKARLARALGAAWPAGLVLAAACLIHGRGGPSVVLPAIALSAAIVALTWRGTTWERDVAPGLIAGAATLLVPAVLAAPCAVVCGVIGFSGGVGVRVVARRWAPAAFVILGPTGAIACGSIGAASALALAGGLAVARLAGFCAEALDGR